MEHAYPEGQLAALQWPRVASQHHDPTTDPDVPKGMSIALLKDLHLLTREGQLNADARRKLKQIRHLVGLLRPALDDAMARATPSRSSSTAAPARATSAPCSTSSCSGPPAAARWSRSRRGPSCPSRPPTRAARFGQERFRVATGAIAQSRPAAARPNVVTALHACDTATDDALALAIASNADHVAVVPCCQAEVARQLETSRPDDPAIAALFAHPCIAASSART